MASGGGVVKEKKLAPLSNGAMMLMLLLLALINGAAAADCGKCNKGCIAECRKRAPGVCDGRFSCAPDDMRSFCVDCRKDVVAGCAIPTECFVRECGPQGCGPDTATMCGECRSTCEAGCRKTATDGCAFICDPKAPDPCASACDPRAPRGFGDNCFSCREFLKRQTCEGCKTQRRERCTADCLASDCVAGLGCRREI